MISRNEERNFQKREVFRDYHRQNGEIIQKNHYPIEDRDSTEILMSSNWESVRFFTKYDRIPLAHIFVRYVLPHGSAPTTSILDRITPNIPGDHWSLQGDSCLKQLDCLDDGNYKKTPVPEKNSPPHFAKSLSGMSF